MFSFFKRSPKTNFYHVDLHSHLIPGIDDGVKDWEESLSIIRKMEGLGIKKIITTPHIIHDYYPNTPQLIREKVNELNELLTKKNVLVTIEAGAEYYIDEHFLNEVVTNQPLLSFGDNYILVETPFINKLIFFEEVIFELQSRGLKPILAHPERYTYLQENYDLIDAIIEQGVLLQININSLAGYYSKEAKNLAEFLIHKEKFHLLGSDIHNLKHLSTFEKAIKSKLFSKCGQLNLLNHSL